MEAIRSALSHRRTAGPDDPWGATKVSRLSFEGDSIPRAIHQELTDEAGRDSLTTARLRQYLGRIAAEGSYRNVYADVQTASPVSATVHAERYPSLRGFAVSGNAHIATDLILSQLLPLERGPFAFDSVEQSLEKVLALYRSRGFSLARIESVRYDPSASILGFSVNEGIIAQIRYEGNDRTKDYVIRREFPLDVGDVFTIAEATQGIVNIRSTGLFDYVLLDVRYEENQPVVILKVKEKSSELLRFGVRADNEHNIVGTLSIRDANFRGAWEDLGLTGRYGYRDRLVLGDYTVNRIFNSYLTLGLRAYLKSRDILTYGDNPSLPPGKWERVEVGKYREAKYGWSVAFGSHFERYGDVTMELRSERHSIATLSGTGYTPESYRYVGVRLQSIVDTEDKFSFASNGMQFAASIESALRRLGSDVSYTKFSASYESYLTIGMRHTLRPKLTFGFADATLPSAEQFSLGGLNSFFGLQEDDSRGRQLFVINMEYRYWLPFKFLFETYLKARYDLGTISLLQEELKFRNFRHGLGIELDLDTPIGPAAFGAGKSFYFRRDLPNSPVSTGPLLLYFSVGVPL